MSSRIAVALAVSSRILSSESAFSTSVPLNSIAFNRLASRSLSSAMVMLSVSSVVSFLCFLSVATSPLTSARTVLVVSSFCCRSSRSDLSALSHTWFSTSDIPLSIFDINVVSVLLNDVDLMLPYACFSSTHDGQFQLISGCVRNLNSLSEYFLGNIDGIPIHHSGRIG